MNRGDETSHTEDSGVGGSSVLHCGSGEGVRDGEGELNISGVGGSSVLLCGSGTGVRDGEGELNISGDCCSGGTTTKLKSSDFDSSCFFSICFTNVDFFFGINFDF